MTDPFSIDPSLLYCDKTIEEFTIHEPGTLDRLLYQMYTTVQASGKMKIKDVMTAFNTAYYLAIALYNTTAVDRHTEELFRRVENCVQTRLAAEHGGSVKAVTRADRFLVDFMTWTILSLQVNKPQGMDNFLDAFKRKLKESEDRHFGFRMHCGLSDCTLYFQTLDRMASYWCRRYNTKLAIQNTKVLEAVSNTEIADNGKESQQDIDFYKQKIKALEAQLETMRHTIEGNEPTKRAYEETLELNDQLTKKNEELTKKNEELTKKDEELEKKNEELEKNCSTLQKNFKQINNQNAEIRTANNVLSVQLAHLHNQMRDAKAAASGEELTSETVQKILESGIEFASDPEQVKKDEDVHILTRQLNFMRKNAKGLKKAVADELNEKISCIDDERSRRERKREEEKEKKRAEAIRPIHIENAQQVSARDCFAINTLDKPSLDGGSRIIRKTANGQ